MIHNLRCPKCGEGRVWVTQEVTQYGRLMVETGPSGQIGDAYPNDPDEDGAEHQRLNCDLCDWTRKIADDEFLEDVVKYLVQQGAKLT